MEASAKVVQRIVKFQYLDFDIFSLNMGPYGSKSFKRQLLWKKPPDLLPKIYAYTLGEGLYQSC